MSLANWDFQFGFLRTASVDLFRDFPPLHRFASPFSAFFRTALGFYLAQGTLRCGLHVFTCFLTRCEDTSLIIVIVVIQSLLFADFMPTAIRLSLNRMPRSRPRLMLCHLRGLPGIVP